MILRNIVCLVICICCLLSQNTAQQLQPLDLDFSINGTQLKNPLTGGINTPQLSRADLNQDGLLDLYIFDRSGNVSIAYLNDGVANEAAYTYSPEFTAHFPDLVDWVLLRDFNRDGVMDIFTAARTPGIPGIEVLEGYFENGALKFKSFYFGELSFNVIPFQLDNGSYTNLYISPQDLPAIDDIDLDGDLDIIAFGVNGGYMELFTNQSVESGFGTDSLMFDRTDCWGGVFESGLSTCVCLPATLGACCDGLTDEQADTRHAGSTILTFDGDGDGDKETVLGDISFDAITYLVNGGTTDTAMFEIQDCNYPSNNTPVDLPSFPATFFVDVDNDGKRDLLAAPNSPRRVEDFNNIWFYKNTGADDVPVFELQQKNLFTEETLDMGSGSSPAFVDFDQDGLTDIIVGTNTFYQPFNERDPRLFAYRNVGTVTQPAYELFDEDYLSFTQYQSNAWSFTPSFGDLDSDGDLDMLVGYHDGSMFYGENTAGPGNPFQFNITPNYLGIDVGLNSVPTMVDINRDGAMDLVIGERNGNLNYLPNLGTATNPIFQPDHSSPPNNQFFGEVDVAPFGFDFGYSSPFFVDFNGEYHLFSGSFNGNVFWYTNIDGNVDGAFTLEDDHYGDNVRVGEESRVSLADINDDQILDMVLGNFRGGINIYQTSLTVEGTSSLASLTDDLNFQISPNPAQGSFQVTLDNNTGVKFHLQLYDAWGRLIQQQVTTNSTVLFSTQNIPAGIYFCKLILGDKTGIKKLIVR